MHDADPADPANIPTAQPTHAVEATEPVAAENLPTGHAVQPVEEPVVAPYCPEEHATHDACPADAW